MSIAGIESEMKWVRKSLRALRDEVIELDNRDIIEAFEDLESSLDDLFNDEPVKKEEKVVTPQKEEKNELNLDDFDDAPMLPQDDDDTYDLQKELEAKFDELFGPLDDDENK